MLFEITSSDSDSEELLKISKNDKVEVPADFSIDALLQTRISECPTPQRDPKYATPVKRTEEKLDLLIIENFETIDATIHDPSSVKFPSDLFDQLETPLREIQFGTITTDSWFHKAAELHPNKLTINADVVYSLLYGLGLTGDKIYGETIINISRYMPKELLEFDVFAFLYQFISNKDNNLLIYPLLLINVDNFASYYIDDLILLALVSISVSSISSNPIFFKCIDNINRIFVPSNPNSLIKKLSKIYKLLPINALSPLFSFVTATTENSKTLLMFYMEMLYQAFGVNGDGQNIYSFIALSFPQLESMCKTNNKSELSCISAIISLIEKIITISMILKLITKEEAESIVNSMQINVHYENTLNLTTLKEQLHLTRAFLDLSIQNNFKV